MEDKKFIEEIKNLELALVMLKSKTEGGFVRVNLQEHFSRYKVKNYGMAVSIILELGIVTRKGNGGKSPSKWGGRSCNKMLAREVILLTRERVRTNNSKKRKESATKIVVDDVIKSDEKINLEEFEKRLTFVNEKAGKYQDELDKVRKELIERRDELSEKITREMSENKTTKIKILWGLFSYYKN